MERNVYVENDSFKTMIGIMSIIIEELQNDARLKIPKEKVQVEITLMKVIMTKNISLLLINCLLS